MDSCDYEGFGGGRLDKPKVFMTMSDQKTHLLVFWHWCRHSRYAHFDAYYMRVSRGTTCSAYVGGGACDLLSLLFACRCVEPPV